MARLQIHLNVWVWPHISVKHKHTHARTHRLLKLKCVVMCWERWVWLKIRVRRRFYMAGVTELVFMWHMRKLLIVNEQCVCVWLTDLCQLYTNTPVSKFSHSVPVWVLLKAAQPKIKYCRYLFLVMSFQIWQSDSFLSRTHMKIFWRMWQWFCVELTSVMFGYEHFSKYLLSCSEEERNSHRFDMTWLQIFIGWSFRLTFKKWTKPFIFSTQDIFHM